MVSSEQTSVALNSKLPLITPVLLSFGFKWNISKPQPFWPIALLQKLFLSEMFEDLSDNARYTLSPILYVWAYRSSLGKILVPDGFTIALYSSPQWSTSPSSPQPKCAAKTTSVSGVGVSFFFPSRFPHSALKCQRWQYKQQRQQKEPCICTDLENHKATKER